MRLIQANPQLFLFITAQCYGHHGRERRGAASHEKMSLVTISASAYVNASCKSSAQSLHPRGTPRGRNFCKIIFVPKDVSSCSRTLCKPGFLRHGGALLPREARLGSISPGIAATAAIKSAAVTHGALLFIVGKAAAEILLPLALIMVCFLQLKQYLDSSECHNEECGDASHEGSASSGIMARDAARAVMGPYQQFLSLWAIAYSVVQSSEISQQWIELYNPKIPAVLKPLLLRIGQSAGPIERLLQDLFKVSIIAFGVWVFIEWKSKFVKKVLKESPQWKVGLNVRQLLVPLSRCVFVRARSHARLQACP